MKMKVNPRCQGGKPWAQDGVLFGNEVALEVALVERNGPFDDGAVGGALSKMEVL